MYGFLKATDCSCNIKKKLHFIKLNVVGAEFTKGAEFSHMYRSTYLLMKKYKNSSKLKSSNTNKFKDKNAPE